MNTSYRILAPLFFGVVLMISSAQSDEDQNQTANQEATSSSVAESELRTATFGLG